uniref:probable inactive serine/threonine-protein kinase lvsG isoform X1 n=1 Tax=Fragaria vesca subsp. vesca TaxID=101020 RepID=UPI0005CA8A93|nr:PREDICTED: probable inactive serine/threonine-protein kinase lvsG isoform X1 [Fragaria vesca subsp. vesca]
MAHQMCFDCLQRRVESEFSGKLAFIHALSDSAFPFGSNAVVQLSASNGEAAASAPQFLLKYLPSDDQDCLTKFVNEYSLDDGDVSRDEEDVGLSNGGKALPQSSKCDHSSRFSCSRVISALAPVTEVGFSSDSIEELASSFLSGSMEDHILNSLSLLIEGKASGRDSVNFLNLLGVPSFDENPFPGSLRHPNIAPILGMVKTSGYVDVVLPKAPYTLENILHYSPDALKSDWHIRFLVYQLLSALAYIHGLGAAHGNICPSSVMLTESCWSWLCVCDKPGVGFNSSSRGNGCTITEPEKVGCSLPGCPSQGLYADLKLSSSIDWQRDFNQWWRGEISNFEYLLILNRLAGRRWGDHTFHTVMPWVIDFSTKPDENSDTGWRDLSKSKWRLAKGDEQLDFTYSTSEFPHHVSDECLSELAVCSYKARRLPLSVLRMAVRSVYEPNEYPSTMQRLYQWTPDECIPEFYCDPQVFSSLHAGMTDLAVPSWAGGPEEFIKLHCEALESDRVSCQLHHWIDITFGYKMSGQAAVAAKNVMLPSSESMMPRSAGRRQLFTEPHPMRRGAIRKPGDSTNESASYLGKINELRSESSVLSDTAYLQVLEDASAFCEHAMELSALYGYHLESGKYIAPVEEQSSENVKKIIPQSSDTKEHQQLPLQIDTNYLLEHIKVEDEGSTGYQELLLWRHKSSCSKTFSEDVARDIFSIGCLLAELHLRRPLFNPASLSMYLDSGLLPGPVHELPPHTKLLVEACIQKDCMRRPSAKSLLESPYFPSTVKASYLFLAPLHLRAKDGSCLHYAANFAKQGVLKAMGMFAAEMCAPFCLSLVVTPLSDTEAEWAYTLLKEFIKSLTPKAVKTIVLPAIQRILQTTGYSHLKVSILQDSFVQEIWNRVGKQAFLKTVHPLVILNLNAAAHKSSAAAASVLLLGSSEELGIPITIHQTILPLIQCFGKGLSTDGLDVLVRIGGLLGESFIVRQMLPLLKHVIRSCIDISRMNKPEPVHSWTAFALIDSLMTIDGLVAFLPREVVVKELIEDKRCLHVPVLMQTSFEHRVVQVAATTLMAVCQRIGPDMTALHVLPQLKELFDELAFSPETANASTSPGRKSKILKLKDGVVIESRMDLALLLYPPFASLLGIEKLRQCCATWLLLERYLLRFHNWKENCLEVVQTLYSITEHTERGSTPEYSPAKLLLNGVGWSIPQSQGTRGAKNLMPQKRSDAVHQSPTEMHAATASNYKYEPWFWFPSPAASWDGPDFLGRGGGVKDEHPWKIRASVIHSVRAHPGALRYLAVCPDESTVFTAGIGAGFRGTVQKWELSRINCVSGYYGHEEVVNDICVLSSSGRVASCDGTIHVWNSRTGKLISVFSEPSVDSAHIASLPSSSSRANVDHSNMLSPNTMSSGILTGAFDGSLYTCMHQTEFGETLVAGTGNGSLRFIDVVGGQKLHLWRGDYLESGFPSIVSTICSCGSDKMQPDGASSPSWIAAGMSSGHCRLFDARSGNVISSWRAHDGYITKLAAPEDHLVLSSSLDKTLRIWDLRRNVPSQPTILRGHTDGISAFSVWGQDIISIARNKIGLSSLSISPDDDGQHAVTCQKLYMADHGARNFSVLSSISILPFSRLFLVGTEDGYLKLCC